MCLTQDISNWDFQRIDEILLAPVIKALEPVANISVESQVLYHTPKSSFSYWDEKWDSYIFSTKDLPFFVYHIYLPLNVNSNEWHLDTSIAAGGRSKILQFVVYIIHFLLLLFQFSGSEDFISITMCSQHNFCRYVFRYIPSAKECPLLLQLPNGEISVTNAFISPMWGGVAVWNPPGCSRDSESKHPARTQFLLSVILEEDQLVLVKVA
ncbi:hypothetical protein CK203_037157 [Vitis vinifera]|uniref:Uncharacterized protein n=1 Tax=Vitis vinifera TaxID=29760 RepID=A0A438HS27_VITVI|nr:hypothetical protein CK203_037157 [Vitis vinifera]